MHEDRVLTCRECGAEFVFTRGQQQFFEALGFKSTPRRCKACRRGRTGAHRAPPRRRPRDRIAHPARCSLCRQETTVPFEPDPLRATFCPTCYAARQSMVR